MLATKYYYAGSQRVALRQGGTLHYLLGDHLGSTSITANSSGVREAELRYLAFGDTRYSLCQAQDVPGATRPPLYLVPRDIVQPCNKDGAGYAKF